MCESDKKMAVARKNNFNILHRLRLVGMSIILVVRYNLSSLITTIAVPAIHHNDSATFVAESAINFSSRAHVIARQLQDLRGWIRLGRRIRKSAPTYAVHPRRCLVPREERRLLYKNYLPSFIPRRWRNRKARKAQKRRVVAWRSFVILRFRRTLVLQDGYKQKQGVVVRGENRLRWAWVERERGKGERGIVINTKGRWYPNPNLKYDGNNPVEIKRGPRTTLKLSSLSAPGCTRSF